MVYRNLLLCAAVSGLMIFSSGALAAGFYIQEQSVSGLGRAFAGSSAHPVDSSTIYYNPAGMTRLEEAQGQAGMNLLHPRADFHDQNTTVVTNGTGGATIALNHTGDGSNPFSAAEPVPNLFISQPVPGAGMWMGLGVTAPFGLSNDYDRGWFGRYDSTSSDLQVIDIAPTVAFEVSRKWSIGLGLNIQHVDADLRRAIPDPANAGGPTPATDGELLLEGDSVAVGYNAGLLWQPFDHTSIGLHYRSEVNHRLDGNLKGTTPAALGRVSFFALGEADFDLPQIVTLAAAHNINDRLTILSHAIWFGWESFNQIYLELDAGGALVDPQEYENTVAFALGAEYLLSDGWTIRAGLQWDETPTTSQNRTTRTPDGNRTWLSGGATYNINDRVSLDLAATYILVENGHVDRQTRFDNLYEMFVPGGGLTATVNTRGTTESDVGILGFALNYRF